ncbi:MAG: hypothetical protein GXP14_08530 [Gammaproteobacteria bacterium]|nr:hypothetical protein [Gammaproteobacteria bacterium]
MNEALIVVNGIHYKIGKYDRIYTRGTHEWITSTHDIEMVKEEWVKQFMSRLKLRKGPGKKARKKAKEAYKVRTEAKKAVHKEKIRGILESGEWKTIKPHSVKLEGGFKNEDHKKR